MVPRAGIAAAFAVALAAVSSTILAGDTKPKPSIAGTVIGNTGKPFQGAEVRAVRVDAKGPTAVATTDSHGLYVFKKLPPGAYSVTVYVDELALSRANINIQSKGWTKLNFDLGLETVDGMNRVHESLRNFIPNTNPH